MAFSNSSRFIGAQAPFLQYARRRSLARSRRFAERWTSTGPSPQSPPAAPFSPAATAAVAAGIGAAAGTAGALAGMGGGFVMIPLMTSLLRLSQHQAHGTSLFAVTATGLAGAAAYGPDAVHLGSAAAIATCGMVSARWGARLTGRLSERTLKRALGALMLGMAPVVPLKAYFLERAAARGNHEETVATISKENGIPSARQPSARPVPTDAGATGSILLPLRAHCDSLADPRPLLVPCGIGLCSGFLAGVFGVGGGVVVVPALAVAHGGRLGHREALATSLAAMVPPAAAGTWAHARAGNVALRAAPALAAGALAGAYLGGRLAARTEEGTLRWGFAALLAIVGARTVLRA